LKKHIYQIYIKSQKRYGSPKITQLLRRHGDTITQRTVSRLMKALGIRSITKKKYKATTHSKHHLPVYPNLLNQKFKVSQPGNVWVANITYGKRTCDISFINKAYTIQEPKEGLIYHSDQGSQYSSIEYQNLLREKGIQSSMSRKGNC
ncbi:TPA: IS3 family transposase, partial [Staphylococcus pseudintermedius]|nr:IS3 family transposase [Staphylococcus pseudintermedius]